MKGYFTLRGATASCIPPAMAATSGEEARSFCTTVLLTGATVDVAAISHSPFTVAPRSRVRSSWSRATGLHERLPPPWRRLHCGFPLRRAKEGVGGVVTRGE